MSEVTASTHMWSPDARRRVRDAAIDELLLRGIDRFDLDGVASRAGVSLHLIRSIWHDRRVLLMDALLHRSWEYFPVPDTGTLFGDLSALADLAAGAIASPDAKAVLQSMLPDLRDADLSEVRTDFWDHHEDRLTVILRRAAKRGELRDDIEPLEALRMFTSAMNYDMFFRAAPRRPEYVKQVLTIFIHGIS